MAFFGNTASTSTEPKDAELVDPPSDSISSVSFSAAVQSDYLAVGSWDNQAGLSSYMNEWSLSP